MSEKILEVKDLDISFRTNAGNVNAIRGVSFDLYKGETLAIVGESGSGKSVTTKAIMGMLASNATINNGSIMFENRDINQMKKRELTTIRGNKIAMIFQDPMTSLNPTMTIGAQIIESVREHKKISKKDAKKRVYDLLELVGISDPIKRYKTYPHQLSGGMRQRVVIAIALASEPDILIADEPTTALDVTIQSQILEQICEIQEKLKLSIIFITHDLGVVANISDRVAVMYAGKIVEYGTSNEIYYEPAHPYTWGLLSSVPDMNSDNVKLYAIPGTTPNLLNPPIGDAFAYRSDITLQIDFEEQPPFFKISDTHYAATWLLHENAPRIERPTHLQERIDAMLSEEDEYGKQ